MITFKKYLILILILSVSCKQNKVEKVGIFPSKIDSLKTKTEIEDFIRNSNTILSEFKLKKIKEFHRDDRFDIDSFAKIIADSLKIDKSFYKSDLDKNGFTDLLFIGDDQSCGSGNSTYNFSCNILLNFGKDSLRNIPLNKGHNRYSYVPKIVTKNNLNLLEIHHPEKYHWLDHEILEPRKKSTLIYKFNSFLEYNPKPKKQKIEKIEYKTGICFGSCPEFDIIIETNRHSTFIARSFNFSDEMDFETPEGFFETTLNTTHYNEITEILNYIDFENLKNDYEVSWTDDHSCSLSITYNQGKIKKIDDYGLQGTYGLSLLYKKLFDLRFNQNWKPIEKSQ